MDKQAPTKYAAGSLSLSHLGDHIQIVEQSFGETRVLHVKDAGGGQALWIV